MGINDLFGNNSNQNGTVNNQSNEPASSQPQESNQQAQAMQNPNPTPPMNGEPPHNQQFQSNQAQTYASPQNMQQPMSQTPPQQNVAAMGTPQVNTGQQAAQVGVTGQVNPVQGPAPQNPMGQSLSGQKPNQNEPTASVLKTHSGVDMISKPLPRFKAVQGRQERITWILANDPNYGYAEADIHYDKQRNRSIFCFGGKCCQYYGGPPTQYFVFLVAHYVIDPTQLTVLSDTVTVEMLRLSFNKARNFRDLFFYKQPDSTSSSGYQDVFNPVDVLTTTTSSQWQTLEFNVVNGPSYLYSKPELLSKVEEEARSKWSYIQDNLGIVVEPQNFDNFLSANTGFGGGNQNQGFRAPQGTGVTPGTPMPGNQGVQGVGSIFKQ